MPASRTITMMTNTSSPRAGPSTSRPTPLSPTSPVDIEEEDQEDDIDKIMRRAREKIRRVKGKGKERVQAEATSGDPDDGGDKEEDDEDDRAPCEQCRAKKISCQMQAGKRSSIICKPCHDAKVKCSYSGRPLIVKKEVSANPTGKRLAVLESQMAQLPANNWQLHEGQASQQEVGLAYDRCSQTERNTAQNAGGRPLAAAEEMEKVVDSEEEEEEKIVEEEEVEEEEGEEQQAPAPKKAKTAASEKGKKREVE
ncbi:hypothetical protein F5879DRAFT_992763 [Lentinula edodes]|nr:hypothetical protein F5879DRAFT_992763 [Lentinula edodes]